MFKKSDYTYKLMEKENKRLINENERLRNQIDEIAHLKNKYLELIDELNECKNKYLSSLEHFELIEEDMKKELNKIMN